MKLCSRGVVFHHDHSGVRALAVGCNKRTCKQCGPLRASIVRKRIVSGAPNRMVTLTLRADYNGNEQAGADALHEAWKLYVKKQRHARGRLSCEYFLVLELSKARRPHLHIAVCGDWIDQAQLSAFMEAHHCGRVTDVRPITRARGAAKYLSKYFTKSDFFIDGRRNYTSSALYDAAWRVERIEEKQRAGFWHYTLDGLSAFVDSYTQFGFVAEWRSDDEVFLPAARPHARAGPLHA